MLSLLGPSVVKDHSKNTGVWKGRGYVEENFLDEDTSQYEPAFQIPYDIFPTGRLTLTLCVSYTWR